MQAANATNSASDRVALDQEVQQRLQEINRIASQTSFNGRKVLDGTFGNATFQVGANVGETISIGLDTSMKTSAIGKIATAVSGDLDTLFNNGTGFTLAAGQLTVNGSPVAQATTTTQLACSTRSTQRGPLRAVPARSPPPPATKSRSRIRRTPPSTSVVRRLRRSAS